MLLLLEVLAPGAFMLWLGLSAILVGIISLGVDWSWQTQLIAFAVFALASMPAWRRFARKVEKPSDSPFLNRRADGYVGRVFTLDKPIVDGVGTHPDRRHGLAGDRAGLSGRQPRQDRAAPTAPIWRWMRRSFAQRDCRDGAAKGKKKPRRSGAKSRRKRP